MAPKLQPAVKKSLVAFNQQFFPTEEHLFTLDNESDTINVIRYITSQRPKPLAWRDLHPYMLAEQVEYAPYNEVNLSGLENGQWMLISGLLGKGHFKGHWLCSW